MREGRWPQCAVAPPEDRTPRHSLALADGSDTQPVAWYTAGGDEPTELTLTYELVLPGGAGTVSGTGGAESVVTRTALEPAD